jgi:hypothetical protein
MLSETVVWGGGNSLKVVPHSVTSFSDKNCHKQFFFKTFWLMQATPLSCKKEDEWDISSIQSFQSRIKHYYLSLVNRKRDWALQFHLLPI